MKRKKSSKLFSFVHWKTIFYLLLLWTVFPSALANASTNVSSDSEAPAPPQWILNHGPAAKQAIVGQGDLIQALGITRILPTGSDVTLTLPMAKKDAFAAEKFPFFAMRYRMTTPIKTGGLFFTTDTLASLSDKSYSPFPILGDGQWRHVVFDMRTCAHGQWKGEIRSFRLDPTNPSTPDSILEVSRFGFFPSVDAAEAFLNQANDEPDYSLDSILRGTFFQCLIPGGTLADGWKEEDFRLNLSDETRLKLQTERLGAQFTVCRNGEPVPCRVNQRGFAWYLAEKPGFYSLEPINSPESINSVGLAKPVKSAQSTESIQPAEQIGPTKPIEQTKQTASEESKDSPKAPGQTDAKAGKKAHLTPLPLPKEMAEQFGCSISSPFAPSHFTRERIRIGGWGLTHSCDWDPKFLKNYADCGFDLLIATGSESSTTFRPFLFQECDKYGIEVYVNDGGWLKPETAGLEYFDHPSFCGHYLTDEPGTDAYPRWRKAAADYQNATGKIPFINLLPMYANAAQLKFGAGAAAIEYYDSDPDLYRKYCEKYCDQVPTDYICTDIYPLNWRNGMRFTYPEYVESINIIASVARERNKEFWCCIQTFGWIPSKRTPNAAEFRWQCWSLLSFGCRGILCWVYPATTQDFPSLVDWKDEKTPAWYDAQTVFREIRSVSDVFCRYRSLGAFTHNASKEVPYLQMTNEYQNFKTIREIQSPDPLLIGCFEAKNAPEKTAFSLVNMTELHAAQTAVAKIRIEGKKITAWRRGVPEMITPDKDGLYVFPLETGEGIFVTVE